ncbi:hypothetical protein [Photobacterium angustum]|uniref:hypothetical protein n=1 Tax=Photobacterium angustum TaxID=661 RepID=UPI0005E67DD1|nr:hypothetical protein [Photobacterium angustum]KJG00100.1 hypothetical protein UB35_19810 [Photobacterium angustum]PSV61701.1 hypothetical protein CTM95_20580 [Photobacterium angustum]
MTKPKTPRKFWTKEACAKEAKKYRTKKEFQANSPSAIAAIYRNGWGNELFKHMTEGRKPNGYWTKERCRAVAKKYSSRSELGREAKVVYKLALSRGWLDDICSHMPALCKPNGYWTKSRCHKEALKYQTKKEFSRSGRGAHFAAVSGGFLDDICGHMTATHRPKSYWTKERCMMAAKPFDTRTAFMEGNSAAYAASVKESWHDEVCAHMKGDTSSILRRAVYAFVFEDGRIYIGISCNLGNRRRCHLESPTSQVARYIKATGSSYEFRQLTPYISATAAAEEEVKLIKSSQAEGLVILNKTKGGELGGGPRFWTKDKCRAEALKYNHKSDFRKGCKGGYKAAYTNKWLDEICSHMTELCKPVGYWDKERCREEASKCSSKADFNRLSTSAYSAAQRNGWLDDICGHMKELCKPAGYWTKELCGNEAQKYTSKAAFKAANEGAYSAAYRKGFLNEICSHMAELKNWDKEGCKRAAAECSSRTEFNRKHSGAVKAAKRNGWYDEVCAHMVGISKPVGYWKRDTCEAEAKKYQTRNAFRKSSSGAYAAARKNGYLDEICEHMKKGGRSE